MRAPAWLSLLSGVLATSMASILIRPSSADALAIVAHRLAIASAASLLVAGREFRSLLSLSRAEVLALLASGASLALHFATWTASLSYTTVASSTLLVATSPIFAAIISKLVLGEALSFVSAAGIAAAVAGAAVMAGGPSPGAALGDALALAGALFAALYLVAGRRLRRVLPTWAYVSAVYSIAAFITLFMAAPLSSKLAGYAAADYAIFFGLALGPSLLGHTSYNFALKYFKAPVVGAVTLGEPLIASVAALILFGEVSGANVAFGGPLVVAGVLATVLGERVEA